MAGKAIFLDTNGWLALLNASDQLHRRANTAWRDLGGQGFSIILTDWIIAETGNGLARTPIRERFASVANALLYDRRCTVIFVTPTIIAQALHLYRDRTDKQWGLVDCASFVIMQEQQVEIAFTTDRHFEQAGFKALLG